MEEYLSLSIRARVAYAALCLENYLKKEGKDLLNPHEWGFVFNVIWSYSDSNPGSWHYLMAEVTPLSVEFHASFEDKDYEIVTKEQHDILQKIYNEAIPEIKKIINLIFEIGTTDLYSSIVNNSPKSAIMLNEIIEILKVNKIEVPDIGLVDQYKINEEKGWGIKFNKSDIVNNNN